MTRGIVIYSSRNALRLVEKRCRAVCDMMKLGEGVAVGVEGMNPRRDERQEKAAAEEESWE